jgi:hypothetical protein
MEAVAKVIAAGIVKPRWNPRLQARGRVTLIQVVNPAFLSLLLTLFGNRDELALGQRRCGGFWFGCRCGRSRRWWYLDRIGDIGRIYHNRFASLCRCVAENDIALRVRGTEYLLGHDRQADAQQQRGQQNSKFGHWIRDLV